ncbi:MAG TPA: hypothetical protein VJ843_04770 [Candidatus Saccharimonadales bacterium]|nr:hypothetical protein [Candidatus Saccharimonadales bacterium]
MTPQQPGPTLLELLTQQLEGAQQRNMAAAQYNAEGQHIRVPGLGKKISSAYEQLRNAAEYSEEHLLLQRAIRRFYKRSLPFSTHRKVDNIGEELVIELTQAGYIANDTFGVHIAPQLTNFAHYALQTYRLLREANVSREHATDWVLDIIAVQSEELLNPHYHLNALASFAYYHYLQALPRESLGTIEQYEICLYIAVHKSLLKSDIAMVRYDLMNMYQQKAEANIQAFVAFNQQVDSLFVSSQTQKVERSVSRYGAPIRMLKSMVESNPNTAQLLADQKQFFTTYDRVVSQDYRDVGRRVNKGIMRSIAFIFVTKMLIGAGVEVPYDLIFVGSVAFLPLTVNLLVPPLYMAGLKLGLRPPDIKNAHAIRDYMSGVLYPSPTSPAPVLQVSSKTASAGTKLLYTICFFVPFAITLYLLMLLHFNAIQSVIFFVFLSTASFLGFRLSSMIRELEIVSKEQNILSIIRDFFYLPYILVGQWLSRKYARMNLVAFVLDMTIELPLKTVLKLFRQWNRFLNEKHQELY